MDNVFEGNFYSPSMGNISSDQMVDEMFSYMLEKPDKFYDIIVGCDSSSMEEPDFPIAIVVLRKGAGGRFFLKKVNHKFHKKKFYNWKQRILQEVLFSCELALHLRENIENEIKKIGNFSNYEFRYIHADVGANGQTKDMIKEVVGLIRGQGFEPKIKPESFAASTIADRFS